MVKLPMKFPSVMSIMSIGITGILLSGFTLPAAARPTISSGDVRINGGVPACLARADRLLERMSVQSDSSSYARSGYLRDGAFRIICYSSSRESSLAVFFVTHESSQSVSNSFLRQLLDQF